MASETAKLVGKCENNCNPGKGRDLILNHCNIYVCARALRGEDGEAHLKRTVEVAVKQSQAAEPQPSRNPTLTSGTSPNPRTATSRTEPAPEAAPNLIWAETPNLTLLGKNNTYWLASGASRAKRVYTRYTNTDTIYEALQCTETACRWLGKERRKHSNLAGTLPISSPTRKGMDMKRHHSKFEWLQPAKSPPHDLPRRWACHPSDPLPSASAMRSDANSAWAPAALGRSCRPWVTKAFGCIEVGIWLDIQVLLEKLRPQARKKREQVLGWNGPVHLLLLYFTT